MYGYFTHGTDPPPRPYSSGFFFLPDLLRLLPSPTHSVADFSVTSFRLLQVPRSSPTTGRAPFPTSLPLIGSLSSGATGDPASPPEVTRHSSVPCRPQSPCFWWVNEKRLRLHTAGSTLPHPRPTSSSSGWRPSITARHFSSCPSDSTSRRTPCPPGIAERWLQVRLGCVRLSSSCPFRLFHTFPLFPADEELPPPLDTALLIRTPEGLEPS
jgi:hypothetical protein